jgi:hypothetical protein
MSTCPLLRMGFFFFLQLADWAPHLGFCHLCGSSMAAYGCCRLASTHTHTHTPSGSLHSTNVGRSMVYTWVTLVPIQTAYQ